MKTKMVCFIAVLSMVLGCSVFAQAQSEDMLRQQVLDLETRVRELEDYVSTVNANLMDFSKKMDSSLKVYKMTIDKSLEDYTVNLNANIENRFRSIDNRVIILNITDKGYRKIDTETGPFLISINKVKAIQNGYRLFVHIGNPNFASYQGVKLNLTWGRKWHEGSKMSYKDWRGSLISAEYKYNGKLGQGAWTELKIDLVPSTTKELEYIELSMGVETINLNLKRPDFGMEYK